MGEDKHTPLGADNFRVGAKGEFHELAEGGIAKSTKDREGLGYTEQVEEGASFELVSRAFSLVECGEEETREAWVELEKRGYDLNAVNNDRGTEGLSVGQIMELLELQKKE